MKRGTVKLSGPAKDKFLERFLAQEAELQPQVRQRLAARARALFTSLRVRKAVLAAPRAVLPPADAAGDAVPGLPLPQAVPPAPAEAATAAPFDAYAVKLVPVFQREGRDGLLARLSGVARVDHLRQMAKAQQVILPQELRAGDASADTVRTAIVEAVAKRIADRRAAAG